MQPLVSSAVERQLFLGVCADHLMQSASGIGQLVFLASEETFMLLKVIRTVTSSDQPDRT